MVVKKRKHNDVNASLGTLAGGGASGSGGLSPAGPPRSSSSEIPVGQKVRVRMATINVGTLTGRGGDLAEMLSRRKVMVACVQEVRWKGCDERCVRYIGEGFKLFYAGEKSGRNGVGVIVCSELVDCVVEVKRSSSRLMRLKVVWRGLTVNFVCGYAPQVGLGEEEKKEFWEAFDEVIGGVGTEERVIVAGDWNGHVGKENTGYGGVHGGMGYGSRNEEGVRVLEAAVAHELVVVNTIFKKRDQHLVTYVSPQGCSQLDLFMCRKRDRASCINCKVLPGELEELHHRVVVMDMVWQVRGEKKKKRGEETVKWNRLRGKESELKRKLEEGVEWEVNGSAQEMWEGVAGIVMQCCREVLGVVKAGRTYIDKETWWWCEAVQEAVKKKRIAFKEWKKDKTDERLGSYRLAKKEAKVAVAIAKAGKFGDLYERLETKEGQNEVFRLARQRERKHKDIEKVKCIRDEAGRVLMDEEEIKKRWEKYFCALLNEGIGAGGTISLNSERGVCGEVKEVGQEEVEKALRKMKKGKAVGPDGIPVEVWKCMGGVAVRWLCVLFNKILRGDRMPDAWRDSWVVPLYKGKGDVQECKNYRGIKLLSHTMKLWERVIEARLRKTTSIGSGQFGFMPGKSTMEPIFALRQTMEKFRKRGQKMHMVFIDLEKAYDKVPRELIWEVLRKRRVDDRYVAVVEDMYEGAKTRVRTAGGVSGRFEVGVGVHQGSALSPYLFILIMDELLKGVEMEVPWDMKFADDMAQIAEQVREAVERLASVQEALESKGLKINREKTEHMESRWKGEQDSGERVTIEGRELKKVDSYKYLGTVVQEDGKIDREVSGKIQAGWRKFREASGVLCDRRVPVRLKGKVYESAVRPAMLYASECWAITKKEEQKLHVAEMRMLRMLCGVTRMDRIRNETIRETLGVSSVSDKMRQNRLRWFGHVYRKPEDDSVRRAWRGETVRQVGRGRPEQTWDAVIKKDLQELGLVEEDAKDRARWRAKIHVPTPAQLGKGRGK